MPETRTGPPGLKARESAGSSGSQTKLRDGLYHRELGLPSQTTTLLGKHDLRYGWHAQEACQNDRYGTVVAPKTLTVTEESLIEVEALGGRIAKMVIRQPYDKDRDIVLVVNPVDGFVRTVWFNRPGDTHKTLDKTRYRVPGQ